MAKKPKTIRKKVPEDILRQLERIERRLNRLKDFMELSAPMVLQEQEVRMICYGTIAILTLLDDWKQNEEELQQKAKSNG